VKKLRDAGAIIGKTNLGEWANFRSTQSSSGVVEADKPKSYFWTATSVVQVRVRRTAVSANL
jgi:Asp-tRNA(Asn)/Glu-tRNA(Gln) amidotransferase A subunit family amidase